MTDPGAGAPDGDRTPTRPTLRVIDAGASPEEVGAIVAAVTAALASRAVEVDAGEPPSAWLTAGRLRARGAGMRRGDWRWSERLGGRVPT